MWVSLICALFYFLLAGDKRLKSPVRLWSHKVEEAWVPESLCGGEPPLIRNFYCIKPLKCGGSFFKWEIPLLKSLQYKVRGQMRKAD